MQHSLLGGMFFLLIQKGKKYGHSNLTCLLMTSKHFYLVFHDQNKIKTYHCACDIFSYINKSRSLQRICDMTFRVWLSWHGMTLAGYLAPVKAEPVTKGVRREELKRKASFPLQLQNPVQSSVSEAGLNLDPGIPQTSKTEREGAKFQSANT